MEERGASHTPDQTEQSTAKIAELFPHVATESRDDDGNLVQAIDFDLLRQELTDHLVEGPQERYQLDWPGKRQALFTANAPIAKTLRPVRDESVDFDNTKNLFIEGDNLDALKLLQESYLGKVKLIYIDPPYNTGNDFVYADKFAESSSDYLEGSGQVDDEGARLRSNSDSNGRFHSDWLSMMYPRLKLARSLLSSDGAIAVSIDDNEVENLRKMMAEIFGEKSFVAQISVQANKGGRDYLPIAQTHEYIVIFARDFDSVGIHDVPGDDSGLPLVDSNGRYEARELRNRNPKFNRINRPNLFYKFYINPSNLDEHGYAAVSLNPGPHFSISTEPRNSKGEDSCWRWGREKAGAAIADNDPDRSQLVARQVNTGRWNIYEKNRRTARKEKTLWIDTQVRTEAGTREVRELFDRSVFDHPKPIDLIQKVLQISTEPDSGDVVMDFFAGSGSTAHAVLAQNDQDGGDRRFILVQIAEPTPEASVANQAGYKTISELSRERIIRAVRDLRPDGISHTDTGFRTLKVASTGFTATSKQPDNLVQDTLLTDARNTRSSRSPEDLLFECMISWGMELTLPISADTANGHRLLIVDNGALTACLDEGVDADLVREIARREPMRAVFRDSSFETDADRINAEQIFKEISPATEVKVI